MKQRITMKPLSLCSPLIIHSYTTLFFLLTTTAFSSVDPKYQACEPKTCGKGPNISYPFYIKGKQEPFCGYPRFGLTCGENGFPILNRRNNTQFIIHEIFYESESLRVSIPAFTDCVAPMRNLTSSGRRFSVAHNQKEVLLFYGCDLTSLPKRMQENTIGCYAGNRTRSVVALYREDANLSIAAKNCEGRVVNTTVEGEVEKGGIKEALQRGFVLNWTASYCGDCSNSGGRCGFDLDKRIYAFRCYCPDRVDATRCDVPSPIQSEEYGTQATNI
ncbi:Wall-associated receptor kinase, galacturonan-binding domain [Sesbania bispinosa]|nr:Wall-associated receptor kinase, galacturonan-binding domain [Sesbania bispinosa]